MGTKKRVVIRERIRDKSYNRGEKVQCKCPVCGIYHMVEMAKQPVFMPRIYCKLHERYREEG